MIVKLLMLLSVSNLNDFHSSSLLVLGDSKKVSHVLRYIVSCGSNLSELTLFKMALRSLTSRLCSLATRPGLHRMASTHVFEKFDDGLVIRQLTKEDLPTVQAWYEKNYNPSELGLVMDLYQADYPHCLLAAEQGGKLVGTASAVPICQRAVYAPEVVVPPGGASGSSVGERLEGFRKNLWDRSHALVGDKERADRRRSNRGVGFTGLSYGLYEGTVTEVPEVPEHVKEVG